MTQQLPVQVATIREFCPVCSGSTETEPILASVPGVGPVPVSCPHCTDATRLLAILEGHRD